MRLFKLKIFLAALVGKDDKFSGLPLDQFKPRWLIVILIEFSFDGMLSQSHQYYPIYRKLQEFEQYYFNLIFPNI